MKKLRILVVTVVLLMSTTMPVMAVEQVKKPIFETDLSVYKEGALSVYTNNIREKIKGKWVTSCNDFDICNCTVLFHILEDTTEDNFYSAFFNGDYPIYPYKKIYEDCSSSMEKTFRYEKSKIMKNLSPVLKEKDIKSVFKNKKTNLYGLLNSFEKKTIAERTVTMPSEAPIIITDLWDTVGKEEAFAYDGDIVFCVPYASTNKEGVLHCEDVVNNILWNHMWIPASINIWVIYIDEVIVRYSNSYHNMNEGFIEIYIP